MQEQDIRKAVAAQFAQDWLLVAMNDSNSYQYLQEDKQLPLAQLSDKLRNEWEDLVQQVVELVEEKISDSASLYVAQILGGQGSLPFDIIAMEIKND
jgi:hypothetical protein